MEQMGVSSCTRGREKKYPACRREEAGYMEADIDFLLNPLWIWLILCYVRLDYLG
jgi:hypothetical protein